MVRHGCNKFLSGFRGPMGLNKEFDKNIGKIK